MSQRDGLTNLQCLASVATDASFMDNELMNREWMADGLTVALLVHGCGGLQKATVPRSCDRLRSRDCSCRQLQRYAVRSVRLIEALNFTNECSACKKNSSTLKET